MDLKQSKIETPIGTITAVGDNLSLHLLKFLDSKQIDYETGNTKSIEQIKEELEEYFKGRKLFFKTPLHISGTPFQKKVWEALKKIPYGKTKAYSEIAEEVDNPLGYRAVAQANGANRFAIIIPCHRVINKSNAIGGYTGGVHRKEWLLNLEQK